MATVEKGNPEPEIPRNTQVLIAGGGPVGLAAAIELGQRGISCVVIEPRERVSRARPRCKTINVRTMEHLRRWGIADRLRARAPLATSWSQDVVFCTSLQGYELTRFKGAFGLAPDGDRSPEQGQQAPQYLLEELLREVVQELPSCQLLTGLRVVALKQTASKVHVTIEDRAGHHAIIAAEYALGCDGPRSTVREAIGSAYVGDHALRPNFGMVFRAPELWSKVRHGPAVQYWTVNPATPALVGPVDLQGTWWIIAIGVDRETGEREGSQLIEGAVGGPASVEILSTDPWTARMQLVDRVRSKRVFLAGDAAHLNPPFGGHGLNTGLGDAVDLGWKLAAVLDGWGGSTLLDSYELERRPIHKRIIDEAVANMSVLPGEFLAESLARDDATGEQARLLAGERIQAAKAPEFHSLDLVLGASYDESPIVADASRGDAAPDARPGARLPHAWLSPGHSLYDELGEGLTLLILEEGQAESADALLQACQERNVPLSVVNLSGSRLQARYGAKLVITRPDQHVAWRGDGWPSDTGALVDHITGTRSAPTGELQTQPSSHVPDRESETPQLAALRPTRE
jgi:2-polyprenyl-6-methoxyphenol hydroxylase-like FAD-dependent oxidoreductase